MNQKPHSGEKSARKRAVGLVRDDIAGPHTPAAAEHISTLAHHHQVGLDQIVFRGEQGMSCWLANLPDTVDILVVPSETHLGAWITAARRRTEVWAADRAVCWPRGGGPSRRISRPELPRRAGLSAISDLLPITAAQSVNTAGDEPSFVLPVKYSRDEATMRRLVKYLRQSDSAAVVR